MLNNLDDRSQRESYSLNDELNLSRLFDKKIWGIDEVCSFTNYKKGTIYNLVSRGEVPYRKRIGGRRLIFLPSEITKWFRGEI